MSNTWRLEMSPEAMQSIQTLSEQTRAEVLQAVGRLTFGPNPPGLPQAYRLRHPQDVWVVRANDRLRVAYEVLHDQFLVRVLDVVARDQIVSGSHASGAA